MKKLLLLLTASFLSLHSQELNEEAAPSEISLNEITEEKNPLLSANELEGFNGEIEELSSKTLTAEPLLTVAEPKKNGLYFFLPTGSHSFFLPGFSFRHDLNNSRFLEISYFNRKQNDIVLTRYRDLFEVESTEKLRAIYKLEIESTEKLGAIYENLLSASYGFKWNTRYIDPYFSLGGGFYLPYVQYVGTSYVDSLPAISGAIGLGFKYGFVDLAINYFPLKWKGIFEYQEPGDEYTFEYKVRLLANIRLGVGLPF